MATEKALEVLGDLAEMDCKTVNFSGGGEPTLHPDFGQILGRASELCFRTWVVTHGGHMEKWLSELLLADHVRVSLDGSTEEEHRAMHRSKAGEFVRVQENIKALAGAKKAMKFGPEIGVSYLLSEANCGLESLHRVIDWSAANGVDFIHFRPLSLETNADGIPPIVQEAMTALEGLSQVVAAPKIFPIAKRGTDVFLQREFEQCYAGLLFAVVGADGNCYICCDRRDVSFGSVYDRRFKDIWLGVLHREKQAAIEPKVCPRCTMCGTNRGLEKYVVRDEALACLL